MTDTPAPETPTRKLLKRDEDGLVIGHPYKFTPDGKVDYKALVPKEHLYVAREYEERVAKAQGKPLADCDLNLVDERWLRIKLAGINYIANLRGYRSLTYHSVSVFPDQVTIVCEMEFIGNYESEGLPVICSGVASASTKSTDRGFWPYLATFAENRAFARCVKRALQINTLCDVEVGGDGQGEAGEDDKVSEATSATSTGAQAYRYLEQLCTNRKHPITFEVLKERAVQHNAELTPEREAERIKSDPTKWTGWASIQEIDVFLLAGKIKAADEAAAAGKKKK